MNFLHQIFIHVAGPNPVLQGLAGGIVIASLNMIGALSVLVWRNPSERSLDGALGFAAGVMLAASFTSLILPGIEIGGILPVMVGLVLGALLLDRADAWVPHVHVLITGRVRADEARDEHEGSDFQQRRITSVILFIVAPRRVAGVKKSPPGSLEAEKVTVSGLVLLVSIPFYEPGHCAASCSQTGKGNYSTPGRCSGARSREHQPLLLLRASPTVLAFE